jgi:molecular chaperone DnaK
MGYSLGVDLGTAYTAAAICQNGQVEVIRLGDRSDFVPSLVYRGFDGAFLFGELAERHAVTEPERISREFKRRIGDAETPIVIGGAPMSAHALSRALLNWVLEVVSSAQGGPPDQLTVSFPANWGPFRRELMHQVAALPGDIPVTFCTEPEAIAVHFASSGQVTDNGPVAVYDLGAGTFDTCLLRQTPAGPFELFGTPGGIEQCGGTDFDYAILRWFLHTTGLKDLDADDEEELDALARLRRDCVEAKEALSTETEVTIAVSLTGRPIKVRLTRGEFEELIKPLVNETVDSLELAIRRSGQKPEDLSAVVLAGGSARIPLVSEMVTERLGRPVTVSGRPKLCVAMGASLVGASNMVGTDVAKPTTINGHQAPSSAAAAALRPATAPPPVVRPEPTPARPESGQATLPGANHTGQGERPSGQSAADLLRNLSWCRYTALALSLLAIILALVSPEPESGSIYRWNSSFAGSAPQLPDGAEIQPELLGIKLPGDPVLVSDQKFDLWAYRFVLGGPVGAEIKVGTEQGQGQLRPQEFTRWRFLNAGFVAMALCVLFSYAYVTSMLRTLRRQRRSASPTELLGLAWAGGFTGIAVVLAAWVLVGRRLDLGIAVVIVMIVSVAVAFLGVGQTWKTPRDD